MNGEKGDGNTILLTVIGVATLLVALVGATFAYFSTQVNNAAGQSVGITTKAPVGLEYQGNTMGTDNILPGVTFGTEEGGQFKITNKTEDGVNWQYDLELVVTDNTLNNLDGDGQLLLTIATTDDITMANEETNATVADNGKSITWDLTNGAAVPEGERPAEYTVPASLAKKNYVFVKNQRINSGDEHTYNMTLEFKDTGVPQDYNQGKSFKAHVEVKNAKTVQ